MQFCFEHISIPKRSAKKKFACFFMCTFSSSLCCAVYGLAKRLPIVLMMRAAITFEIFDTNINVGGWHPRDAMFLCSHYIGAFCQILFAAHFLNSHWNLTADGSNRLSCSYKLMDGFECQKSVFCHPSSIHIRLCYSRKV